MASVFALASLRMSRFRNFACPLCRFHAQPRKTFVEILTVPKAYLILLLAVIAETIGTTSLQASQQFSRFWPSVLVVVSYGIAFYLLGLTLRFMPVGIVYAIWSGLGIFLIAIISFIVFGQRLDWPAVIGLIMILAGILIIHLFSKTAGH